MTLGEFMTKKTRVSLTWFVAIVLSVVLLWAAYKGKWEAVMPLAGLLTGLIGAYQVAQSYTKGKFIDKVGEAGEVTIDKKIEP